MNRAINSLDPLESAGFENGAGQRLVDDRGGAAALGNQNSRQKGLPLRSGTIIALLGAPGAREKERRAPRSQAVEAGLSLPSNPGTARF
jgi:hypothetical protein